MINANDLRLDGNAVSGLLGEIFGREMSTVRVVCAGCAAVKPIAALMVHRHGMGTILRCEGCDEMIMCITLIYGKYRLSCSGLYALELNAETH